MFIVGEYILLHFMDSICWPAPRKPMVFLHPGDKSLNFFSLPRSRCVGSLRQARRQRAWEGGDVVMVVRVVAVAIGKERRALSLLALNEIVE